MAPVEVPYEGKCLTSEQCFVMCMSLGDTPEDSGARTLQVNRRSK